MIKRQRVVGTFLDLVRIDGPSGEEQAVARFCTDYLSPLGFSFDSDAAGNLFCKLPGHGAPLLVNAHMDSVQPCIGIKPIVDGDIIRSDGTTILGADDRSAVAAILEVMQVLAEDGLPHPPLEVVFTVREELGLMGSRAMDYSKVSAQQGIVLDHAGPAGGIVIAAPYQDRLVAVVHGKAAHAGGAPEKGISAIRVAAEAIAAMPLGRIDAETTSNIGLIRGGTARNVVPATAEIEGEARSRDEAKLEQQTGAMVDAFKAAAARYGASVDITVTRNYSGFRAGAGSAVLQRLMAAARAVGIEPRLEESGGGSDVNVFRVHGIDALAISAGYGDVHTTAETQSIPDMVKAAEMLLKAITL
jgi:tripeptide aminopeptidase